MTLQELRYLVALADTGHFARAAEICHISQSTLSTQIKKLEDYLGVMLFDRGLRRIATTPVAHEIVNRARAMVQEAEQIRRMAKQAQNPMDTSLQLGVIPTLGPYLLPRVLPAVHLAHPKLRLLLREETTAKLLERLAQGSLDAALLALPLADENLHVETLFYEPFIAALPLQHPLAKHKTIKVSDLIAGQLLLLEEGHCLRDQALQVCGTAGSVQSEEVKATSLETLRQMVAMGLGCTLMPALAVDDGLETVSANGIAYRRLRPPVPGRTVGLAWRQRSPRQLTLNQLTLSLKAALKNKSAFAAIKNFL